MDDNRTTAERIRDSILEDVTDRRGWGQEWNQFDDDIQEEIKQHWLELIEKELLIDGRA